MKAKFKNKIKKKLENEKIEKATKMIKEKLEADKKAKMDKEKLDKEIKK